MSASLSKNNVEAESTPKLTTFDPLPVPVTGKSAKTVLNSQQKCRPQAAYKEV